MRVLWQQYSPLPFYELIKVNRDEDCISKPVLDKALKIPVKIVKKKNTSSCVGIPQFNLILLFSLLTVYF